MQIILLVIVSLLSLSCESKDFCEAFAANGFKINYPLQSMFPYKSEHLVIGSDYWIINETEASKPIQHMYKSSYQLGFNTWNEYVGYYLLFLRVSFCLY